MSVLKRASADYAANALRSKDIRKINVVVHILQTTQNWLIIGVRTCSTHQ